MNDILFLPVKPKWAKLIMSGQKTIELRKRLPSKGHGKRCVIYASSPMCEILGTALFAYSCDLSDDRVYPEDRIVAESCVSPEELRKYFDGAPRVGLRLCERYVFMNGISLFTMRQRWQLEPPQQWRYIDKKTFDEIVEAGK